MTKEERKLSEAVLGAIRTVQENPDVSPMPCPRCGKNSTNKNMAENALSRYLSVYICSECGVDEALPQKDGPLPIDHWELIKRITGSKDL